MNGPRNRDPEIISNSSEPDATIPSDTLPTYESPYVNDIRGQSVYSERRVGRHSRFVSAMKVALPLGAAALLLTVLFYSGVFDKRDRLDITFREIASLNNDLRMISPKVTGLDRSGQPYVLTADTATQAKDHPNHILLDNLQADLKLSGDEEWISLSSTTGQLDSETEKLQLEQKIDVYLSSGYEFHGVSGQIDFREGTFSSDKPVEGQGPAGTLRADSMTANNGEKKIVFTGRVKMILYGQGNK